MLDQLREKIRTAQDKDVEDKKGTQPKRYYAADADGDEMSKSTKDKRAAHFAKHGKKADDDASAYKPAPGDKSADLSLIHISSPRDLSTSRMPSSA